MDFPNIAVPVNPKVTFFFNSIPSKTLHYDENASACGINGCGGSGNSLGNQIQYNPLTQLPYKPPAPIPLNYSISSCGNCGNLTTPLIILPKLTNFEGFTNIHSPSSSLFGSTTPCGNCLANLNNSYALPLNIKQVDPSVQSTYQNPDDYYNAVQAYQNNFSPIQRKIDTTILFLFLDPNYPKYANEDLSMQRAGTVIPATKLGPNGITLGDAVHVYIYVEPGTSSDIISPYVYGELTPGSDSYSAIVPLKNIYALASLNQVIKITLATSAIYGEQR